MLYRKILSKIIAVFLTFTVLLGAIFLSGCSTGKVSVKDKDGQVIAELAKSEISDDILYKPYLEVVIDEAISDISNNNNCDLDKSKKMLFEKDYIIETCFDANIYEAIEKSYLNSSLDSVPFGCAVTNLNGGLCAVYSCDINKNINYANTALSPYSSFKPLSVYAPAIENNTANWSKVYEDSPYKKIKDENGEFVNWPKNATDTYTNSNITVYQAVKESLNTVAVKCLSDYGVNNSISFLKENFDINLDYESKKVTNNDEDEVIGNLAMGYLYKGVTVKDMAGYYQIFANGGKYYKPEAITKIIDENGKVMYAKKDNCKQVLSESTTFIMNKLLQGVVQSGGTGAEAKMDDIEVGGKTGTGIANDCHWFVGFVPQYSCAVWHGGSSVNNYSPQIFKTIMQNLKLNKSVEYPKCRNIKQAIYCVESGLLCSKNCKQIDMGYYVADDDIGLCKIHN